MKKYTHEVGIFDALDWRPDISLRQSLIDEAIVAVRDELGEDIQDYDFDGSVDIDGDWFVVTLEWEDENEKD